MEYINNPQFPHFQHVHPISSQDFTFIQNPVLLIEERKKVRQFLLQKLKYHSESRKKFYVQQPSVKIHDAKVYMQRLIVLREDLNDSLNQLTTNDEDFDEKWEHVSKIQAEIQQCLRVFNKETVHSLKTLIKKRTKQRENKKKRKHIIKMEKSLLREKKKVKMEEIDKWLNQKKIEAETIKDAENFKRQTDEVLREVTKKKNEGKKILATLVALKQLRHSRNQREIDRGRSFLTLQAETFENVVGNIIRMWEKQMENYKIEEQGLKLMLSETVKSTSSQVDSNILKNLHHWKMTLFDVEPEDAPNYGDVTAAENDVQTFLQVRNDWDQFISPYNTIISSAVPAGWVLPVTPSSDDWKKYLKKQN